MATTYTASAGLPIPGSGDRSWDAPLQTLIGQLDGIAALGGLAVATTETPSTTLHVKLAAGFYRSASGAIVVVSAVASQTMTASATNYLYLTDAGVLTVNTTGWPADTDIVRLATVVTGASTVTSVTDQRVPWQSSGRGGTTPAIVAGAGAGTGPTVAVSGSDRAGLITVTTGTSPTASAVVATVTFGAAFGAAPRAVTLTPAGSNAAALTGAGKVWVEATLLTASQFTLNVVTALAASTAYKWFFAVSP